MLHFWLLLSWFGSASLQFINGDPLAEPLLDPLRLGKSLPFPYVNYLNNPAKGEVSIQRDAATNTEYNNPFLKQVDLEAPSERQRRLAEDQRDWLPNLLDSDKTMYIRNEDKTNSSPFVIATYSDGDLANSTDAQPPKKRSFSPWGGKRAELNGHFEQMWTWKRTAAREPSMPKRVRFSPWGGKRSGQVIYKPNGKSTRVIYSTSVPELTRIMSNYYAPGHQRINFAGFRFRPIDKRHPLKIVAVSRSEHTRDAMPFKMFLDSLPIMFKPGHPYVDVNLNTDGKRKVKFSAWGGKRSPPIIGPIWTPAEQDVKESTLNAILLVRNSGTKDESLTKTV